MISPKPFSWPKRRPARFNGRRARVGPLEITLEAAPPPRAAYIAIRPEDLRVNPLPGPDREVNTFGGKVVHAAGYGMFQELTIQIGQVTFHALSTDNAMTASGLFGDATVHIHLPPSRIHCILPG